jgi:hypothetical protein
MGEPHRVAPVSPAGWTSAALIARASARLFQLSRPPSSRFPPGAHPANEAPLFFWSAAACRRLQPRASSRRDEARADGERGRSASRSRRAGKAAASCRTPKAAGH